jgi:LacI family transcriptional regulator
MQRTPVRRRLTINDIAHAAGVSVPTVSKVVNGRADVSATTREHVQHVINELGYVTGRAARALRHGSSGLIDVAVEALDSEYVYEIIRGIEEALEPSGLRLVLSATGAEPRRERQWMSKVTDGSTDGAILVLARGQSAQLDELSHRGIPFVVVDHRGETGPDIPSVGATNFAGGRAATEHLLSLGHRRIAVIGGPVDMRCSQERIAGYRAALEAAGVPVDPALIRNGTFHLEAGEQETRALLELPVPPTAIFGGSDLQALGVYNALRTAGISVPGRMSVVGFDDVPMAA